MVKIKHLKTKSSRTVASPLSAIRKDIINKTNKHYGYEVIIDDNSTLEVQKIPTGILSIDVESGGGVPRGRGIILVGEESTFKSSLLYKIAGSFQRICGNCMRGEIIEKHFNKVNVVLNKKSNDNVLYDAKTDVYTSLHYFADKHYRNFACPEEKIRLKKSGYLYRYDIECTVCDTPSYSFFGLLDAENNYTMYWAQKFNVVNAFVLLGRPEYSEQTGDLLRGWLDTGRVSILGVDSVDALGPQVEDENSFEDQQMGVQARVWNKITRAIHSKLNKPIEYTYKSNGEEINEFFRPNPSVVLIQQYREKIGAYGDPRTMGGGRGKQFLSSLTIDLRQGEKEWDKIGKEKVGIESMRFNFEFKKNKVGVPHRTGGIYFNFNTLEIDNALSLIDYGLRNGKIKQSGSWYICRNIKAQGRTGLAEKLRDTLVYKNMLNYIFGNK